MENINKFQQMQDEMSRFETAIAVSDTAAMGLLQPAMAAGTFGNMQQRMDNGTMPQYQHTNITAMMFSPIPPPPQPPQMIMVPQQVQQHSAPAYPLHIDSSSQLQYQLSHHEFQPSHHEFQPSHQEFQLNYQEYQPSHSQYQPSQSEYQPSYQEYQQMHQQYHDMVGPQLMAFPPAPQPIVLSAKPKLYKLPKDAAKKEKHERKKKRKAQLLKAAEEAVLTPAFVQPPPPPGSAHFDAVAKPKKEKKNRKVVRTAGGQVWEDVTLLDWADDDYRLFCGDLGNDVTDDLLIRTFSKYTSFQRAKVVRDKRTNKSKGFGFVSFKDPRDFMKAMKEMDGHYVGSRPIKLRKSTWRHRSLDVVRKKEKEKQALISLLMTKN